MVTCNCLNILKHFPQRYPVSVTLLQTGNAKSDYGITQFVKMSTNIWPALPTVASVWVFCVSTALAVRYRAHLWPLEGITSWTKAPSSVLGHWLREILWGLRFRNESRHHQQTKGQRRSRCFPFPLLMFVILLNLPSVRRLAVNTNKHANNNQTVSAATWKATCWSGNMRMTKAGCLWGASAETQKKVGLFTPAAEDSASFTEQTEATIEMINDQNLSDRLCWITAGLFHFKQEWRRSEAELVWPHFNPHHRAATRFICHSDL